MMSSENVCLNAAAAGPAPPEKSKPEVYAAGVYNEVYAGVYAGVYAMYMHAAAGARAMHVLGADVCAALDEFASPGALERRAWAPHAQGVVDVAASSGVRLLRSRRGCLKKLVLALGCDDSEAEMRDWALGRVWGSPLPVGHGCEAHVDYRGRHVFLIAPTALLESLRAYVMPYLGLTLSKTPPPFAFPCSGLFLE